MNEPTDNTPELIQLVLSPQQRDMIERILPPQIYIAGPIPFSEQDHECCQCAIEEPPSYFLGVSRFAGDQG